MYIYNIAQYKEIYDDFGNLINLEFVNYINNDIDENKDLLILTNINDNHYNLTYYNNNQQNKNSIITDNKDINTLVKLNPDHIKYEFKKLENLHLKEILSFYDDEDDNSKNNLSDIYYYLYHYFKSGKTASKFSDKFKIKYKNSKNFKKKKNLKSQRKNI